ncbi:hypothetical protein C3L33_22937, partial [Rhododendron williamsianum]
MSITLHHLVLTGAEEGYNATLALTRGHVMSGNRGGNSHRLKTCRSAYSSKETDERGYVAFKRIDFLGSRKSFEMMKRVNGDNNSNVYEFLIRA